MKSVEVIIPIYNEEKTIKNQVIKLRKFFDNVIGKKNWNFIFIDNGSTDNSRKILEKIIKSNDRYFYKQIPNYGVALREGIINCNSDYAFICDIDQWDLPFFSWCWAYRKKFDYIVGSRRSDPTINKAPLLRKVLTLGLNIMITILFNYMGTDTHGPKFVNMKRIKNTAKKVISRRGQFDTELLIRLSRGGFKIAEAPIKHFEIRKNKFPIIKKILWNIYALIKMYFFLKKIKWKKKVYFNQFCRDDVLKIYNKNI
jgi:glycosyltransferase involved in cell wall biosynthesis